MASVLAILPFPPKLKCAGPGDGVLNRASEAKEAVLFAIVLEDMLKLVVGREFGFECESHSQTVERLRGYILE